MRFFLLRDRKIINRVRILIYLYTSISNFYIVCTLLIGGDCEYLLYFTSAGSGLTKRNRRSRLFVANIENCGRRVGEFLVRNGLCYVGVVLKSPVNRFVYGSLFGLCSAGVRVKFLRLQYGIPHNGCRRRKLKRL